MKSIKYRLMLVFALFLMGTTVFAQKPVYGVVTDSSGQPLAGASIMLVDAASPYGVISDLDGRFSIDVPDNSSIEVSFLGFVSRVIHVKAGQKYKIILEEDANVMEEVVVVGFGTQKKESVVGAISSIKPKELDVPARSLNNTIAGRVAGIISVQSSGEPGKDDANFWIRGISTFTGSSSPLVLVDGVERPMNNVDPLEIESFSVLKDASATAVYGVRGANGVILINTKKGFDGKARVDARYEHGFSWATQRPKYMDAVERAILYNEAVDAVPGAPSASTKYTDAELVALRDGTDIELYPNIDWQKVLMKDVTMNEKFSVNISGGGKNVKYFSAISVYNQEGQYKINPGQYTWVPKTMGQYGKNVNYIRYNFRSNIDMSLSKSTTVSLGLQGNVANNTEPSEGSDNVYLWINNCAPDAIPILYKDGTFPGKDSLYNPYLQLTQLGYKVTTSNELRANLSISQDFSFLLKGLSAKALYAYDAVNYNNAVRSRKIDHYEALGRDDAGDLIYKNVGTQEQTEFLNYSSSAWGNRSQYVEGSVTYNNIFGKHDVGGLILFYMKDYRTITASNYLSSLPNRTLGLAARVTYAYDNRYLLEANLGYNGSENFPKGQRMGLFPSIAAGWTISNESFLKDNSVLTWLKIRASFGQVGSDQIGSRRFAYLSTLAEGVNGYNDFGINYDASMGGIAEDQMAAENITWEIANKYNVGLEFGLWNSLKGTVEGFYELRDNIFLQPQTSEVAGLQSVAYANMGKMSNKGFEITLEYNKAFTNGLILTARGNYTFARNKYIENGKVYPNAWQDVRGTRYGERLLYDAMHLFSQEEIDALPDYYRQFGLTKSQLRPGDIRYRDVNDDGRITEDDRIWATSPGIPESVVGIGASLAYKGFDFSFLLQGAFGATAYLNANGGWYFYPFQAERAPKLMGNYITNFRDRWTEDNPDQHAFAPRLYMGNDTNNYVSSTWWVRKNNYLRLKNVELGYTLPRKVLDKSKLENLRFYVSGQNLYNFSRFAREFWDPEVNGISAYPIQATVFIGVNITF